MATPKRPFNPPANVQGKGLARGITADQESALLVYAKQAQNLILNQLSLRSAMMEIDRLYMREVDYTAAQWKARVSNRVGDTSKIQNVTLPVIMPQVEAALSYMQNVFLTGYPIFGVASDPTMEDAALQINSIFAENAKTAGWAKELTLFFRDGLKYNLHAVEMDWQQKSTAGVENDVKYENSAKPKKILWQGNRIKRMDMYNTFFDPRVHPSEIHEYGEWAGYIEPFSRVRLKKFIADMITRPPTETIIRALNSSPATGIGGGNSGTPLSWYMPNINPFPIMNNQNYGDFDWVSWITDVKNNNNGIRYNNMYEMMKMYCRIVPADFGLDVPEPNTPQVWKLIIVNGQVILCCERLTAAHDWIPIFFGQPLEDGLDFQTKSFASNVADLQSVASALMNAMLATQRRNISDRVLYNPLNIRKEDISSTDPAAKIPVRASAFGKPLAESVYAFPFRDTSSASLIQAMEMTTKFADQVNQQNPAQQGQFVPGNKTLKEYSDVMGHGNGKNQSMALMTENQVFGPLKTALLLNVLQYQKAGPVYNTNLKRPVDVDPVSLRQAAVAFTVTDGLMPEEKLLSTDGYTQAMQTLAQNPSLGAEYNMGPLFSYLLKTQGADLSPFEKSQLQVAYEQQLAAWQQAAQNAAKVGQPFSSPQPQMPPALQQELQAKQANGGVLPVPSSAIQALSLTTGTPLTQQVPTQQQPSASSPAPGAPSQ